jgi:hypothetical protein
MWVFTIDGFYSAVEHRDDRAMLMVRCRSKADADRLAIRLLNVMSTPPEVRHTPEGDYAYRVSIPREAWAWYLWQSSFDIDYPNFKDAVYERRGGRRAHLYGDVWATMLALQYPVPEGENRALDGNR